MTVACTVTRTVLSLADLDLAATGSYAVDRPTGPGQKQWTRQYATSPYVHGGALVTATQQQTMASLIIRVFDTTAAGLETKTAALLAAFEQFTYTVTLTIDGVAHVWVCDPADYQPLNGEYDDYALAVFQQAYVFAVPHQPVTSAST